MGRGQHRSTSLIRARAWHWERFWVQSPPLAEGWISADLMPVIISCRGGIRSLMHLAARQGFSVCQPRTNPWNPFPPALPPRPWLKERPRQAEGAEPLWLWLRHILCLNLFKIWIKLPWRATLAFPPPGMLQHIAGYFSVYFSNHLLQQK